MDIPAILKSGIRDGSVVLMLGAGASSEASDTLGRNAPSTKELVQLIADRFLGGKFKELPLNQVAEIAASEADLVAVQEYIRGVLEPLKPARAHRTLCTFNWFGLATTNFDRLVEEGYREAGEGAQRIVPFIDNNDRVDDKLRDPKSLAYLKLHGCITRTTNSDAPLILATEQYVQYRQGRSRVFDMFKGWCYEHIVVFIGSSVQDPNLRHILLEVDKDVPSRPQYFMVAPDIPGEIQRMWMKKNVHVLDGTFGQFVTAIDDALPSPFRIVKPEAPLCKLAVAEKFVKTTVPLSDTAAQFLSVDVEYVRDVKTQSSIDPRDFYKGVDLGWNPIVLGLDVRRAVGDSILVDHFIDKREKRDKLQLILIKAYAGAGKKTLLHRIAWDAAHEYGCLCLYLTEFGCINSAALAEVARLTDERIFLFVENACDAVRELTNLVNNIGPAGAALTIITTARTNEWNMTCQTLSEQVTSEYELKYLSHKDIETLLSLLEKHNALGTLRTLPPEARKEALTERAGRQLLVALHEATLGKSFEQILRDEYENIRPTDAQRIYLSICVLNRLDIPVRAGIIARMYGIGFTEFKRRFFGPLELVVHAQFNPIIRDYEYRARHSHIAEIVVEEVLRDPAVRFQEHMRCLRYLNISYASDRRAFYRMIRANDLMDVFHEHSMVKEIYELAQEVAGKDQEVLHQMAIYEMKRDNGKLETACALLEAAHEIASNNHTIIHSMAELKLRMAEKTARTDLEFKKYVDEAQNMCVQNRRVLDSFGIGTLIKGELLKLERMLNHEAQVSDADLEHVVNQAEEYLEEAIQNYPGEHQLLNLEATLARLLSDSDRVIKTLAKSFELNPKNSYVALRLARCYEQKGMVGDAIGTLRKAIDANSNKKELHYSELSHFLSV